MNDVKVVLKDKTETLNGKTVLIRVIESDAFPKLGKFFGQIHDGSEWVGIDTVRKSSLECARFTKLYVNEITDWE